MELKRRDTLVYGVLLGIWLLVVGWQVEEHSRVESAAKTDLRNRSTEIADTLSAVVRASRFRGAVVQDRFGLVLNELARTNELVGSAGVLSIALLNTAGDPVVTAGDTNLIPKAVLSEGELWTPENVTFVNPVWGASIASENSTNATVVLPPPDAFSNSIPRGERFDRREFRTNDVLFFNPSNPPAANVDAGGFGPPPPDEGNTNGPRHFYQDRREMRRPPWLRFMSEDDFKALIVKRELHGLVLTMSTENLREASENDLWMRLIIVFFAGISAVGVGMAWRNVSKTSELQIRLVRASELNSHLREMNLAAAGLAHETRNPLNIKIGRAHV